MLILNPHPALLTATWSESAEGDGFRVAGDPQYHLHILYKNGDKSVTKKPTESDLRDERIAKIALYVYDCGTVVYRVPLLPTEGLPDPIQQERILDAVDNVFRENIELRKRVSALEKLVKKESLLGFGLD